MASGPEWSQAVIAEYTRFLREELLGSLKALRHCLAVETS